MKLGITLSDTIDTYVQSLVQWLQQSGHTIQYLCKTNNPPPSKLIPWIKRDDICPTQFDCILFVDWNDRTWFKQCKTIQCIVGSNYPSIVRDFVQNKSIRRDAYTPVDMVWLREDIYDSTVEIYKSLYRTNQVHPIPFFWDPSYLIETFESNQFVPTYDPSKRTVAICCDNKTIHSCAYVPFITCVRLLQMGVIDSLSVFNADHCKKELDHILSNMEGIPPKILDKIHIYSSYTTLEILSTHSVLIHHSLQPFVPSILLESAFSGFPVIHTTPLCKKIGYYYTSPKHLMQHVKTILSNGHTNANTDMKSLQSFSVSFKKKM